MRRFLPRLGLFLLLQAIPLVLLASLRRQDPGRFFAEAPVKRELLERTAPPRLVLVGGSGVAFGFDGAILRERLGRSPVNMGLHAGLGIDVILGEAGRRLRAGDVVVVSLEYDHFRSDVTWEVLWELLEYDPGAADSLGWPGVKLLMDTAHQELFARARSGVRTLAGRPAARPGQPYQLSSFNEWGDVAGHWDMEPPGIPLRPLLPGVGRATPLALERPLRRLEEFAAAARARGASVHWSFPAVPRESLESSREPVGRIHDALRSTSIPLLDDPDGAALPLALFFDTSYHLGREGAVARSERLAAALLSRPDAAAPPAGGPGAAPDPPGRPRDP